jgi:single-strand DNA-binding protein
MQMIGLARLGRDAEIRTTSGGESVASLSLAFHWGRKGEDGNRPTQWVDGALWGKLATALQPYLLKGTLVAVTIDDPHIEEFQGRNGPGHKLAGRVSSIELAGGKSDRPAAPAPRPAASNIIDDDIPF